VTEELVDDTAILTPDQRLRVFVSSTLGELADERAAASRAISTLRLTPVLFDAIPTTGWASAGAGDPGPPSSTARHGQATTWWPATSILPPRT
jgi:Domain of unknown function (DUF4062)